MTAVVLVAVVSVLTALATTLALRAQLVDRLDQELRGAGQRASGPYEESEAAQHEPDGDEEGHKEGARMDEGSSGSPPRVFGQGPGTLTAEVVAGVVVSGGVIDESGDVVPLPDEAGADVVRIVESRQKDPHDATLSAVGDYRVLVRDVGTVSIVTGLPTASVDDTVGHLVALELGLVLAGVTVAGGLAVLLVRRQLRPLRQVASTAHDVAAVPLSTGEVRDTARVPDDLTDDRTEVGQVGSALNTLLDHVEQALRARHASEQQVRQFVADASHELRTPLATIKGYAELSRHAGAADETSALRHAMGKVEVEAERMSSLVEDLLLLARLDAGRPLEQAPVDLTRLVLEDVDDARVLAPEHRWVLELADAPVVVTGDRQRLHQTLVNLLGNARWHTPPGTTVTVRLRPLRAGGAELVVHDNGPGVPEELAGRVFERFTRGDAARTRASGSVGLGLSLVHAIVAAHGGQVSLASRPGSTTFTVRLP